jgi:hypothetical protein
MRCMQVGAVLIYLNTLAVSTARSIASSASAQRKINPIMPTCGFIQQIRAAL